VNPVLSQKSAHRLTQRCRLIKADTGRKDKVTCRHQPHFSIADGGHLGEHGTIAIQGDADKSL
jgi:hypothetical protein